MCHNEMLVWPGTLTIHKIVIRIMIRLGEDIFTRYALWMDIQCFMTILRIHHVLKFNTIMHYVHQHYIDTVIISIIELESVKISTLSR